MNALEHITIGTVTTSVVTHTANGLCRIPAMMVSVTAAAMVGELALRTLGGIWSGFFGTPSADSWPQKVAAFIHKSGARPYGEIDVANNFKISNRDLVLKAVAFSALAVLSFELASFLCGPAPTIYNNFLTFIGPVRFSSVPYLQGVQSVLSQWGLV